jgi:type IV secretory pathway protease TraF
MRRAVLTSCLLLFVALVAGTFAGVLRINLTASAPRGLWWRQVIPAEAPLLRGEWVCVQPTPSIRALQQVLGIDGSHELLKQAVVFPGETWCYGDEPCQTVAAGEVVVQSNHPQSFDSRVYGPIPRSAIVATATPLFTWGPPYAATP